ncbi:MAG: hypothetical protein H8D34_21075 [Chloroflexi bacterium]|nr:hypothetical protein [Chloroflexota bacterium]
MNGFEEKYTDDVEVLRLNANQNEGQEDKIMAAEKLVQNGGQSLLSRQQANPNA